ncbi:MAG: hypothetical protein KJ050_06985 [Candidatus Omnitrophica bacterium]|nr:hypothetical protein [bacterium]MCL4734666.1 hypothetical protein [Candidatus Omnitrophota bacterium]
MPASQSRSRAAILHRLKPFTGQHLSQISFPLGGIGTGSVGLSGRGGLIDWEILNRPSVGSSYPRTFPVLWVREKGKNPICKVLEAPPLPPCQGGGGGDPHLNGEGLPHMDSCTFLGEYPFAWLDFKSRSLPVSVQLEAYNPFIPNDPEASGFPAAILRYKVTNRAKSPVQVTLAWSVFNMIGSIGVADRDPAMRTVEFGYGKNINRLIDTGSLRGIHFCTEKYSGDHPRAGDLALVTPNRDVTLMRCWLRGPWFSPMHDFWDTFSTTGLFIDHDYPPSDENQSDAGAVGIRLSLKPGESRDAVFYLTWYFPNFEKYWHDCGQAGGCCPPAGGKPVWKNYYASRFENALDVAERLHSEEAHLHQRTQAFHQALFGSSLPEEVLDAVSSQMAILKTATCIRLPDGTFYGFEGCAPMSGCCEGSCTHVWNYQQALPFLFPSLERSMRTADYQYNLREDGGMCFRLQLPLGSSPNDFHAAADGQMGGLIKLYRDWKISGDDTWLESLWPRARKALEFAWVQWDPDQDGVIDGIQHNTYDIEFHGPNPLTAFFYLGALRAGAEIAEHLGEFESADRYREIFRQGATWVEQNLFNGEYFIQQHDPELAPMNQFGPGCLTDQLLGQWISSLSGLGDLIDPGLVRKSLKSIFRHNWRKSLKDHANMQRVYALNEESGLLLCSWPRGGRPRVPFPYSDEVWTGIEYQVASHLILEGLVEEGLEIVRGARDRFDGIRRNPWDEFECGHHYARAMSSYGLLLACSGFQFDRGAGLIGFDPRLPAGKFQCFWSLEGGWGIYRQNQRSEVEIEVIEGTLPLKTLILPVFKKRLDVSVTLGAKKLKAWMTPEGLIDLQQRITLKAGQRMQISAKKANLHAS